MQCRSIASLLEWQQRIKCHMNFIPLAYMAITVMRHELQTIGTATMNWCHMNHKQECHMNHKSLAQ